MSVSGLDGPSVASLAAHSLREQTVIKCPGQDAGKRRLWHSELLALHKAWLPAGQGCGRSLLLLRLDPETELMRCSRCLN